MNELLLAGLLGGVLALDATSVGQFMVSRPLVAGVLSGWALGDPALGLAIGGLLEFYLLVSFPTGGGRFPEGATATVVAVATAVSVTGAASVPLGVAAGLVWGQVGGMSISLLRRANGRLVPEPERVGGPGRIVRAHLGGMLMDFARGVTVTVAGVAVGRWAARSAAPLWPLGTEDSAGLLLLGAAASAGIFLRSLGGFRRRRLLFAGGLLIGILGGRVL